jgi:hypothetical protein
MLTTVQLVLANGQALELASIDLAGTGG